MKRVLAFILLVSAGYAANAQCNKKVILTTAKTEYLRADSSVERTVMETTTFEFDEKSLLITDGSSNRKLNGTINSYTCDWTVPFKKGKMELKATITDDRKTVNFTIIITGNGEQTTCLTYVAELPGHLARLIADKFEEAP